LGRIVSKGVPMGALRGDILKKAHEVQFTSKKCIVQDYDRNMIVVKVIL